MLLAFGGALLVGLSLGLLGSGGSILTVPILVYLVGEGEKEAIAESLGIVGAISLAGLVPYALKKQVDWRSVFIFGLPGMAGTWIGALLAAYISGNLQLVIFAFVMILAAILMIKDRSQSEKLSSGPKLQPWWMLSLEGLAVGVITGLVGVGGGFLIVPALVIFAGLPIHLAIGTSLTIIAMKSIAGFIKYLDVLSELELSVNWDLFIIFSLIGSAGSLAGKKIGSKISAVRLRKIFAFFLLIMGFYIMYMNIDL